jgi:hypothetical protein
MSSVAPPPLPATPLRTYGPFTHTVDPQHVAAFARSLEADAADVPPTYAAVYAVGDSIESALADDDLGIDFPRMLHGEQEFHWSNHPRVGETLTSTAAVISDEMNGSMRLITLSTDVSGSDGRPVCTSRTVLVVR